MNNRTQEITSVALLLMLSACKSGPLSQEQKQRIEEGRDVCAESAACIRYCVHGEDIRGKCQP